MVVHCCQPPVRKVLVLFCFFKVFKHNFIYSFLALVGLSWLWQVGSTPIVCGLLTMVASLVTERGL